MPMAGGNSNPWLRNGGTNSSIVRMDSIDINLASARIKLFSSELDRVMGGGLVKGSVVLLAGEPGIGKSTILLQLAASIAKQESVVYISGEENAEQVVSRATRLGLPSDNLYLLCETDTEIITENILSMDRLPELLIVDSIQTMYTSLAGISTSTSSAGSVTQIRESTARFVQLAKATGIAVLLVGHVTKSGEVAGPRVLEHMVDTVLYLEGSEKADYRMIRSMKNRYLFL